MLIKPYFSVFLPLVFIHLCQFAVLKAKSYRNHRTLKRILPPAQLSSVACFTVSECTSGVSTASWLGCCFFWAGASCYCETVNNALWRECAEATNLFISTSNALNTEGFHTSRFSSGIILYKTTYTFVHIN